MSMTVLQIVHSYNAPFLDLAAHYSDLVRAQGHRSITLFLSGRPDPAVAARARADQVLFWELSTETLRGFKLTVLARLRRLLHEQGVTLLLTHRYKALYLGLLASVGTRLPVIGVAHAFGVMAMAGRRALLRATAPRWQLLGVSAAVAADLRADLPEAAARIHALPNVLDVEALIATQLERDAARARLGLTGFLFGNVGRLHPDKDQVTLLRGFARMAADCPAAQLVLIGSGREEARYRALAAELGVADRVHFKGFVADAPRLFRAFDVYVSSSDREPFGMVLTEAMAAALPVISSDCGGAPEVVGDQGHYFRAGDDAALAAAMRALYEQPEPARRASGDQLRARVRAEFSPAAFQRRALALPIWPPGFKR